MSYDPSTTGPKLPKIAPAAAVGIVLFDANGNLGSCLMSDYLAWVQTQATDLSASTVLSSLPSDFVALGMTGGAFALAPKSLLGTSGGSSGSNTSSAATTFTVALSSASGAVGATTTMTVTPGAGGWPSGVTVTPTATSISGPFSPTNASPSGTTPVQFAFTASAAATGTLNASASGMTSGGGQTYTATAAAATTYSISTASTGTAGTAQTITVQANGTLSSSVVITLSDGASGTFGGTVTLSSGSTMGTTSYTPASSGTKSVTGTNNGTLTNPGAVSVVVAAAGTSYPAFVFSSGANTFDTTAPRFGAAAWNSQSNGQATIDFGSAKQFCIELWARGAAGKSDNTGNWLQLTDSAGNTIGIATQGQSLGVNANGQGHAGDSNVYDGQWHFVALNFDGYNATVCVDGGYHYAIQGGTFVGGVCTLAMYGSCGPNGTGIDDVKVSKVSKYPNGTNFSAPSTAASRDANTLVIYTFDQQDGRGS